MSEPRILANVLAQRRRLRTHEHWSREALERHQAGALRQLRDHAYARSAFYRRFHDGLETRPLHELPVLTKAMLMEEFDELVTDPELRLGNVLAHLETLAGNQLYLDRYWVTATAGSTGRRGIFVSGFDEWMTVLASYARANEWAGVSVGLTHSLRVAVVSSRVPSHQSARVEATLESPFVHALRLDATDSLASIVAELNELQPQCLVGYASMVHALAREQLSGSLHIAPKAIISSSEVLTDATRRRVETAWGQVPFNVYAATETAGIASDCVRHRLHLYEDLVIVESVDEHDRPVPPGVVGAKVLVTVLFSRTQPLIRYEMSDTLALAPRACDCGKVFALVERVEGRREDVLDLAARAGGTVAIHPNVFHRVLESVPAAAWQVVQTADALDVLLERPALELDLDALADRLRHALDAQGVAAPRVELHSVERIEKTGLGKAPLIRRAEPTLLRAG